jgi:hypothetical protein
MAAGLVQPAAVREGKQTMVNREDSREDNSKGNREAVNCEMVWREVSNYIDEEVDPVRRSAMDAHFKTCAHCRSVLEGARNVIALYSDERMIHEWTVNEQTIEVPAGYSRRLEKRLAHSARASRNRWPSFSAWLVPLAALALLAGGLRVANSLTSNPPLKITQAQPGHDIPPDMLVVVSADTKLFHVAGCPFIHNKDRERTLTAKEAIEQGYTPCLRCLRKYLEVAGNLDSEDDHDAAAEAESGLQGEGR